MGVGTLFSRNVLSNRSGSILHITRILAASLTLLFILSLRPDAVNAQNANIRLAYHNGYQAPAYKKRIRYKKRRYRSRKKYRKKSRRKRIRPVISAWPSDQTLKGPVQLVISLPNQRVTLFKAGKRIASAPVSTGRAGLRTPSGIFSIIQKNRRHFSNLYAGAPMPNMQRITWSGIAMHAGSLPGYPASHGCIRMPYSFSKKLFGYTQMGDHVVVARGNLAPKSITHNTLFQPIPASDQVGPRVQLEKQANLNSAVDNPGTPSIHDLTQDGGHVYNTSANQSDLAARSSTEAATNTVLKKLASLDATTGLNETADTQSILRHHLIQKMRRRQWPKDAQRLLKRLGLYSGRVDGDPGRETKRSVKRFQSGQGMPVTGKISKDLILALNRIAGQKIDLSFKNVKLPRSGAPMRILITRKKSAETAKIAQKLLTKLGYDTGGIDGDLGKMSIAAIRDFQRDRELRVTGELSDNLMTVLYKATGTTKPGDWHLYVRQEFLDMFDAPVQVRDSSRPIGTHLFTAMHFEKDATSAKWTSMTLRASSGKARKKCKWNRRKRRRVCTTKPARIVSSVTASKALDRIIIPEDVRNVISELLTPGSSMAVTDNGISYETGEKTDFIVLTR